MLAQTVGAFLFPIALANFLAEFRIVPCLKPHPAGIMWQSWAFIVIGGLCLYYLGKRILRPRIVGDSFQPTVRVGDVAVPNPFVREYGFAFATSHPVYVLADLPGVILFYFLQRAFSELANPAAGCGALPWQMMFAVAAAVPLLRLVAWYGLGRRIEGRLVGMWKPLLLIYAVLVPAGAITAYLMIFER